MAMLAKLYGGARAAERHVIDADATLRGHDQLPIDILVADLSTTGCLFVCTEPLDLGGEITIGITGLGRRQARIVRAMDQRYGCTFLTPLSDADVSAASSLNGDTIVRFPHWPFPMVADDDPPPVARLSGPVRLAVVVGGAVATWSAIIALLLRLR